MTAPPTALAFSFKTTTNDVRNVGKDSVDRFLLDAAQGKFGPLDTLGLEPVTKDERSYVELVSHPDGATRRFCACGKYVENDTNFFRHLASCMSASLAYYYKDIFRRAPAAAAAAATATGGSGGRRRGRSGRHEA